MQTIPTVKRGLVVVGRQMNGFSSGMFGELSEDFPRSVQNIFLNLNPIEYNYRIQLVQDQYLSNTESGKGSVSTD